MTKTNVCRLLELAKVPFEAHTYPVDENDLSGVHTAAVLGFPPEQLFKTLVLKGERTGFFVCCIPCDQEVDLRLAAQAAGDKKAEMLPMKDLLSVAGYMRGACSPVGMKKRYPTFFDETVILFDEIAISGGARGVMLKLDPQPLIEYVGARILPLTL